MLIEVFVPAVAIFVVCSMPTSAGAWFVAGLGMWAWWQQGGFFAWNPKNARQFMKNAKEMGL
jgi:hypothetical protein